MTTTATPNLRETRKEMAAAKKAPAKATTTKPAAAKKAPAKAPAKKAAPKATTPAARKLRWTVAAEHAGGKEQHATVDGHEYAITRSGEAWKATVKSGGKTTVLSEGTFAKAYAACVAHNRQRA